jgi:hypothetical protein
MYLNTWLYQLSYQIIEYLISYLYTFTKTLKHYKVTTMITSEIGIISIIIHVLLLPEGISLV